MKWKIEKGRFDATYLMINTEFEPKNDVLRYILAQIKIANYPEFISFQSTLKSYGEEHVHIMNYAEMDWEDKLWARNTKGSELDNKEMFLVHDVIGEIIIKEELFDRILFDYGKKLLEVYRDDNSLPGEWNKEMQQALEILKTKIDNEGLA